MDLIGTCHPVEPDGGEFRCHKAPSPHHVGNRFRGAEAEGAAGPGGNPPLHTRWQPVDLLGRRENGRDRRCPVVPPAHRALSSTRRMRAPRAPSRCSIRS
jgi:hypothetical protein